MASLRPYVPAAILLAGCALIWHARSQMAVPLSAPLSSIVPEVAGYDVTDLTVSAEERRVAGMTNYVARSYARDHVVAFTTLVSYYDRQTQGKSIHSPRNCLPGAGWEITQGGRQVLTVDGSARTVNRYVLRKGRATAVAYYWYQGRGRVTASEYVVKWNLLRDAALAGHTEEALVRVVIPVPVTSATAGPDDEIALHRADAIGQSIVARLMRDVERVLPNQRARSS